jgi:GNAT superfamily N-acetyltransferase
VLIRRGSTVDFDVVIGLMDQAVAWLAAVGRTGQWGSDPISASPERVERMRHEVESNDLWIAEIDGEAVGAMLLGEEPMPYVAPVEQRELYLHLLVTSRRFAGHGIGQALVDQAKAVAADRGSGLIRVDCYAGGDRKLVAAYERMGFMPTQSFTVGEWPGQVLEVRLRVVEDMSGYIKNGHEVVG